MIHVVTDSCSDIPPKQAAVLGITVVPLTVRFGDDEYRDGVDIDPETFYVKLAESTRNPTTSQPSPADFSAVYQRLLADPADSVVSIHISQKLSGTMQSATLAAADFNDRVRVIDSESASSSIASLACAAKRAVDSGKTVDEVVTDLAAMRPRQGMYALIGTLEYLVRGGRAGRAQGLIGGVLHIKPMITVTDGEVAPAGRVRGTSAGIDLMLSKVAALGDLEEVTVMHASAPDMAETVRARLLELHPALEPLSCSIGPVIGTYSGPRCVGVAWVRA